MSTTLATTEEHRTPRYVTISAWAAPIMVLGGFALFAVVPVALVLVGALRDARAQALRWPATALAASYATPLAVWLLRPDGAESLSKDIHPAFVALVVAASAVVLATMWTTRRRARRAPSLAATSPTTVHHVRPSTVGPEGAA